MDQAMMDRFNLLKREFDEVCQHEQKKLVGAVPKVLYHYTNVRGFMGILSSGELQVSNIPRLKGIGWFITLFVTGFGWGMFAYASLILHSRSRQRAVA
jgi:hypothetical protein